MARVDQRSALHVLNRTRLEKLAWDFDLEVSSRAKKDELVDALARSRRASYEELLGELSASVIGCQPD